MTHFKGIEMELPDGTYIGGVTRGTLTSKYYIARSPFGDVLGSADTIHEAKMMVINNWRTNKNKYRSTKSPR